MNVAKNFLEGKTALVTGGARGLGKALCEVLCAAGARVVVADLRDELADKTCRELSDQGHQVMKFAMDVGDEDQVAACVDAVQERFGALDILINNAGVDHTLGIDELEVAQWDQVMNTNVRGPFLLSKRAVAQMKPRRQGHIINIASTAAKRSWPNASAYNASKWALLGFSHALHAELRPHGVKVTAIVVGGMRTPFLLDRFPDIDPSILQDPREVAPSILNVLAMAPENVVAEMTILPMGESSWP